MDRTEMAATRAAASKVAKVGRELMPVDREILEGIPVTPRGDRSERWAGVQHGVLANAVLAGAASRNLIVETERWRVSRDGSRLFGDLSIAHSSSGLAQVTAATLGYEERSGYGGFNPQLMGLRLGILSANDSSYALTMIVIARVLVCSNGLTVDGGHITAKRKHTTGIGGELPEVVAGGLDTYIQRVGRIGETHTQLSELDFTRQTDVDHTMMEAGRRGLFPWSKLGKVEEEWRSVRHPEFRERNGWSLMNCFSEVAKRFNPVREIQTVDKVRELIVEMAPNN